MTSQAPSVLVGGMIRYDVMPRKTLSTAAVSIFESVKAISFPLLHISKADLKTLP